MSSSPIHDISIQAGMERAIESPPNQDVETIPLSENSSYPIHHISIQAAMEREIQSARNQNTEPIISDLVFWPTATAEEKRRGKEVAQALYTHLGTHPRDRETQTFRQSKLRGINVILLERIPECTEGRFYRRILDTIDVLEAGKPEVMQRVPMAYAWIFHQEPNLYPVIMQCLATDEALDMHDFWWAGQNAQSSREGGVYMLFCLELLKFYVGKADVFHARLGSSGHGAKNVPRNTFYREARELCPDFDLEWVKIILLVVGPEIPELGVYLLETLCIPGLGANMGDQGANRRSYDMMNALYKKWPFPVLDACCKRIKEKKDEYAKEGRRYQVPGIHDFLLWGVLLQGIELYKHSRATIARFVYGKTHRGAMEELMDRYEIDDPVVRVPLKEYRAQYCAEDAAGTVESSISNTEATTSTQQSRPVTDFNFQHVTTFGSSGALVNPRPTHMAKPKASKKSNSKSKSK